VKAVTIPQHGGVAQVQVVDLPTPEPRSGEVLLRVRAAALNRLDLYTMAGIPGLTLAMPHILGSDAAGMVEKLGAGVEGVKIGDRMTFNPGVYDSTCERCQAGEESECDRYAILGEHLPGAMAEFVRVPTSNLYRLPDSLSYEDAAAASLVYQTAWRMVVTKGQAKPGDIVVVLGAGSGLSTAAIQIAALCGARVIATSSSDEKLQRAKTLGATDLINYRKEDWSKRVWQLTEKRGADLVVDAVGKETLNASVRAVRKGGAITIPGGTSGQQVHLDLRYVFWKQVRLLGSTMGNAREFRRAMDLVASGRLKPAIGGVYPAARAREAFELLERGGHFGKLVVTF
jgi:NADPH:quinone reductase-like Zn-dependent oxidoreductase